MDISFRFQVYTVLFLVFLAIVALAIIFVVGYTVFWYLRNWFSRVQTVRAKVVRKKSRHHDALAWIESTELTSSQDSLIERIVSLFSQFMTRIGLSRLMTDGTDCFIVFAVDGKELEFCVPTSTYIDIQNGTSGILSFKGERFKSFTPLAHGDDSEDLIILK